MSDVVVTRLAEAGAVLYYPVDRATGIRLTLAVTSEDRAGLWSDKRGAGAYLGVVTDLNTGKRYRIYRKSCGLKCCCDAWAREDNEPVGEPD